MEATFLCAKYAVELTHAKLAELRAKAASPNASETLKRSATRAQAAYLAGVTRMHHAVRQGLLQITNGSPENFSRLLLEELKVVVELPGLGDIEDALNEERLEALAERVRQERAAKLAAEVHAMRSAAASIAEPCPVQPDALEAVVRNLSTQEQGLDFHVRLAAEVSRRFGPGHGGSLSHDSSSDDIVGGNRSDANFDADPTTVTQHLPYSLDNFAYGSTPYTSWLKVLSAAGDALRSVMTAAPGREYVVWGSSAGWLVLYGALTYGWRSRGVEILRCLHEVAQQVAAAQADALARTGGVCFTCGDLLDDDVRQAGVVLLADQCWDEQLAAAAAIKLAAELSAGALCVSYTGTAIAAARELRERVVQSGGEGSSAGVVGRGHGAGRVEQGEGAEEGVVTAFEEVAVVRVPVSWLEEQPFHVFRRR